MYNPILEMSEQTPKNGRVPIKIALLKIHDDSAEANKNGLHWDETYVTNALDSTKMMPICAEFMSEEKDVPFSHGLTDAAAVNDEGINEPLFLNSEVVGVIESADIETVNEGGNDVKVLAGTGFLYNQRYPNFVKWVRQSYAQGTVDTSIEIMGLRQNDNKIVYLEDEPKQEFRTPKEFAFSGTSILSVSPADDNAVVLEIAQKKDSNKEEPIMDFNMDEVKAEMRAIFSELNDNDKKFEDKIAELNEQLTEKDQIIADKDAKIVELNATVEQVQQALDDLKKEHETYWAERDALEKELGELKAQARIAEMNAALDGFSDEQKQYAEVEINAFKENPMDGNIDNIVTQIYAGMGRAAQKQAEEDAKVSEQNAEQEAEQKDETIDIFSEIFNESASDEDNDEEINIF